LGEYHTWNKFLGQNCPSLEYYGGEMNVMEQIQKQTILIVDDEPGNIKILNELLYSDYKIRVANNGEKALQIALSDEPPDLILLDIMMPGMDGYEVCRRLKEDIRTQKIPVIFVTGKVTAEDEVRGFEVGAIDYITKPFNPVVVKVRVATQLALKMAENALREERDNLHKAIAEILALRNILLSTCCYCKRIKDKHGKWQEPAEIMREMGTEMSHGVCPDCLNEKNPLLYKKLIAEGKI
jgi:response regulator RpfG family c-di-GMP phosphodiesterase